ncbi:PAS domain S-box protein [Dissulfurirhabdus thermomarina]|uniref:histidine kinase n=1 Tax=Dissulfurirhabdus thermomarina TaxID=1765737 RepID=A0A6N9TPU9_DISTH|nr:PAS domain S-box protein [Dissulfurirhabdus thermomarina]
MTQKVPEILVEIWEQIPQAGAIHDGETCLYANEAFARLFGFARAEDVVGRPMGDFFSPWPAGYRRLGLREHMGRRRDGSRIEVEMTCLPCEVGGGLLFQSLLRDVTARRSWEGRLLQAERLTAMGKLAGEIAHEINNPLGGILLYGKLIREDLPPESPARGNLDKILKLATRCRIIAKGLLNFGRSDAGPYAPVDVNHVVRDMLGLVRDHKIFQRIRVAQRLDPEVPHIMGDRGQVEQVVLNLIINAAEAMDGGGVLRLETAPARDPDGVRFVVEDDGPGIPEDLLPKIFEPFFTTKRLGKGTGLGLSITHGIVQRHGGRIEVRNRPEGGARFDVFLPLRGGGA